MAFQKPNCCAERRAKEESPNVIEIERGDTLWGFSRKYGVFIHVLPCISIYMSFFSFLGHFHLLLAIQILNNDECCQNIILI